MSRQRKKTSHHPIRMIHHVLRQTSRVATAAAAVACTTTDTEEETIQSPSPPLQTSFIKTTIDSVLLRSQQTQNSHYDLSFLQPPSTAWATPLSPTTTTTTRTVVLDPMTNDIFKTAAFSTTNPISLPSKQPMGIVMNDDNGDHCNNDDPNVSTHTTAGISSVSQCISNTSSRHPDILFYEEHIDPIKQRKTITKVRIATPNDDMDVAYLRMSVFSDVHANTEFVRSQFCTRSCQAIAARRLRGAICFVATTTTTAIAPIHPIQPPQRWSNVISGRNMDGMNNVDDPNEIVVGSIECSYHEFFHTRLGSCRKQYALLYITEVAVHSSVRRHGFGTKLLQAVDRYATQLQQFVSNSEDDTNHSNNIESLYLHVDVSNHGAIRMYEQCGFYKVLSNDPIYTEFTTGLNLQPGATRGREHYLLCKHLVPNPIWLTNHSHPNTGTSTTHDDAERPKQQRHPILSRFGIEIPA